MNKTLGTINSQFNQLKPCLSYIFQNCNVEVCQTLHECCGHNTIHPLKLKVFIQTFCQTYTETIEVSSQLFNASRTGSRAPVWIFLKCMFHTSGSRAPLSSTFCCLFIWIVSQSVILHSSTIEILEKRMRKVVPW